MARSSIPKATVSMFSVCIGNNYPVMDFAKGKEPEVVDTKLDSGKTVEFKRPMTPREGFEQYLIEVLQTFVGQYELSRTEKDWKPSKYGLKSSDGVELKMDLERPEAILIRFTFKIVELQDSLGATLTPNNVPAMCRDWLKVKVKHYNDKLKENKMAA